MPEKKFIPIEKLTYEQAFAELEELVRLLDEEERPLEEAIAFFERGQALSKHCADLLDKAELKVRQIIGDKIVDLEQE